MGDRIFDKPGVYVLKKQASQLKAQSKISTRVLKRRLSKNQQIDATLKKEVLRAIGLATPNFVSGSNFTIRAELLPCLNESICEWANSVSPTHKNFYWCRISLDDWRMPSDNTDVDIEKIVKKAIATMRRISDKLSVNLEAIFFLDVMITDADSTHSIPASMQFHFHIILASDKAVNWANARRAVPSAQNLLQPERFLWAMRIPDTDFFDHLMRKASYSFLLPTSTKRIIYKPALSTGGNLKASGIKRKLKNTGKAPLSRMWPAIAALQSYDLKTCVRVIGPESLKFRSGLIREINHALERKQRVSCSSCKQSIPPELGCTCKATDLRDYSKPACSTHSCFKVAKSAMNTRVLKL